MTLAAFKSTCWHQRHGALALILIVQAIERAAWNGLAPQLPDVARALGASEGRAAFYISLFLLVTYVAAYPLSRLTDRYLSPGAWCAIGLLLLSGGYGLLGQRSLLSAALVLPAGFAFFRLGVSQSIAGLDTKQQPSWWLVHLAVNVGIAAGGWSAQQLAWRWGLPMLCYSCAAATFFGSILCLALHAVGSKRSTQPDDSSDPGRVAARWWAVRWICVLTVGAWLAVLQPFTTMVLFTRRTAPQLGPFHLGVGSYVSLHAGQVIVVVLLALALRRTATSVRASSWATVATAAGFAVLACASLRVPPISPLWLLTSYALLALAEPYLFVASARSIERLAPAGYHGQAFGAWYASIGLALFTGALYGLCWDRLGAGPYFALLAIALLGNAALLARLAGRLDRVVRRFG